MKLKQLLLIITLTTLIACGTSFGKKKEFGNLEIFYSKSTPIIYVNNLGKYFVDHNLILNKKHSIKLTSNHKTFILKLILNPKLNSFPTDKQPDLIFLESDLKQTVFKNVNFEIEICDVNFYPLNKKH